MKLTDRTVTSLLDAFRSREPTPGGGSAAALAGAMGASLLAMVAGLPKSRAATAEDAARLKAAGERCTALASELSSLIDRDSDAYGLVMAAYKRPKATEDEKAARSAAIQDGMRGAIAAPLSVMRACTAAAEQGVVIAEFGNASAASDGQVGLELLGAALRGAKLNVEVNLASVKDAEYAAAIRREVEEFERAIAHETAAARRAYGVV
ncbi:MAG TPA: cyclodeaminase/cyclohydrolase family protein [Vicinamibacterales bacterium]|nr:cyclodeaminase/cyclohydrolase family protein [Vicinamibacterales bacterium]